MIDDRGVWQAAVLLVKRYGDDAMLEAAARADQLQDDGDWQGAVIWHRILDCIERMRQKATVGNFDCQRLSRLVAERMRPRRPCRGAQDPVLSRRGHGITVLSS